MTSASLQVTNPFNGDVVGELPTDDASTLNKMLAESRDLFLRRKGWLPLHERIEILLRTQVLMRESQDELAMLIAIEGGKPLVDAIIEVERAIEGVGLCVDHVKVHAGERIPLGTNRFSAGRIAMTSKEPIGVVASVSAFNHPLNLIVHQVAPAVAAGCPVIVKPASVTPLSCVRFVEILHAAGLPPAWCRTLIPSDSAVSEALVTDPRIGFFSFIGSARVGWMLNSKLAPGVRCALEHGGAAPVIICDDADLDLAVPALVKGGYYHAGQVCVSVQRIFVPRALRSKFVDQFQSAVAKLVVGDPTSIETQVGPLIRPKEVERVHEWVNAAIDGGASCVQGGKTISERVYAPTILVNPAADATVTNQEIFGPVVCIYDYDDEDVAVAVANSLPVAFQASVFTESLDSAMRISHNLAASAVMVNDHTAFRDDVMPFAGLRESGLGVGGIPHTIEDMQIDKMIVLRSGHR
ncbi:MAG: acyl-CoA reductase-like NAD-dependent aldehyde dehydrogenase [Gammaproteobacteria bacterium]|jgi:acyl-CoA reductase-like NAD-dependent aldehyde dehydrogenase